MYDSALRTQRSEPQTAVIIGGMISCNVRSVISALTGLLPMPASQNAHLTEKRDLKSNFGSFSKDKLIVTLVSPHSCPSLTHSFLSQGHLEYEVCSHWFILATESPIRKCLFYCTNFQYEVI